MKEGQQNVVSNHNHFGVSHSFKETICAKSHCVFYSMMCCHIKKKATEELYYNYIFHAVL